MIRGSRRRKRTNFPSAARISIGNYQVYKVISTGEKKEPPRGFSVNLPARLTELSRLSDSEVNEMFGPFKPQLARSKEQIDRNVQGGPCRPRDLLVDDHYICRPALNGVYGK